MPGRFLIVNNGLKDLQGHYFETAVSTAQAARECGWQPILAAHATCPAEIIPDWIEFYPLFTTDHWLSDFPPPLPDLGGVRGDLAAVLKTPIDAVCDGRISLEEYLQARFEPLPPPPPGSPPPLPTGPRPGRVRALLRETVPPGLKPILRGCYHVARSPLRWGPGAVKASLPPFLLKGLKRVLRRGVAPVAQPTAPVRAPFPPPLAPAASLEPPQLLARRLLALGATSEVFAHGMFHRDLGRLLCLTGAGRGDHVYFPTAHGRELAAAQHLLDGLPESASPTFHFEFRHSLELVDGDDKPCDSRDHPYTRMHQVYFDHYRRRVPDPRVRLYTDTDELSEEFRHASGLPFRTLPIPFRAQLLTDRERKPDDPLCLTYLGDVREEKGFFHLPPLVEALREDAEAGRVRFLIQASVGSGAGNPKSSRALRTLVERAYPFVTLVGLDAHLPPDEYYDVASQSDVLLCPYSAHAYRRRSSGTLTEGIALGVPTVVPADTWLSRQQPPGAGEVFTDLPSLISAVRRVCSDYPRYRQQARTYRDRWLTVHTPANLIRTLLEPEGGASEGSGSARVA